ncbi:hypothetical protein GCM10010472_58630 [Pseudonocardia halophobica]|uniref:Uncharacterized protein n=1 Tax=Pseudonocardia halophobica TaxID=29401 RepID=A0A9W6NZY9_9PSEU|nr:hypothetical protein [Pseudonocardia halophobica]GLL15299.1 hypothetical protein GCM10017577_64490 [Pseudonocardia halophobica]
MCLFVGLLLFGPRIVDVLWWLVDPVRWNATFDTVLWPILGIVFLPLTTLVYVLVAPGGIHGFDAVWLALAFLIDLSGYAGSRRYGRRGRRVTA